jgi:hypothetical protein
MAIVSLDKANNSLQFLTDIALPIAAPNGLLTSVLCGWFVLPKY